MPSPVLYPLDTLGTSAANLVTETRQISASLRDGRKFIVPKKAPFHMRGCVLRLGSVNAAPLVLDQDYSLVLPFEEFNQQMNTQVYGGILFLDPAITGTLFMTLQLLGGEYTLPVGSTIEELTRLTDTILFANWGSVAGVPSGLPVFSHIERLGSTADFGELITSLQQILLILTAQQGAGGGGGAAGSASAVASALNAHLNSSAAHTPTSVGLGNVKNYPLASVSDFAISNNQFGNNRYTTPFTVMYAINRYIGDQLTTINEATTQQRAQINSLAENMEGFTRMVGSTDTAVDALSRQIATYNTNYSQVQANQQDLLTTVGNLQTAIASYQQTIVGYNSTLQGYQTQYTAVIQTIAQINGTITQFEQTINGYLGTLNEFTTNLTQVRTRLTVLEQHLYPLAGALGAGSHTIRVKPNSKIRLSLLGAGGGAGTLIPHQQERFYKAWAQDGEDTTVRLLSDLSSGEFIITSTCQFIAQGGGGGQSSVEGLTDMVHYGAGGLGGKVITDQAIFPTVESGQGNDGQTGVGSPNGGAATRAGGSTFYSNMFGSGGSANDRVCGQGGAGAKLVIDVDNTTGKDIVLQINVGRAGRSVWPQVSNALDGICVIQSVN